MKIAGLNVSVENTTYRAYGVLGLIPVIVRLGYTLLTRRPEPDARAWPLVPLLGVGMATFHAVGQFVHQLGHAIAARLNARPMSGVRYSYVFSFSEYPSDEPPSPPRVHIQRSLGGFVATLVWLASAIVVWMRVGSSGHWFRRWLVGCLVVDAVLLVTGSVLSDVAYVVERGWEPKDEETPSS